MKNCPARKQAQMANRFLVRWEEKIEGGIAPPQLPGHVAIVSRKEISTLNS